MGSSKLIFDLIISFSKLIFILLSKWLKAKMEEKILYYERMKNFKDLMDKMITDNSESTNEADFLSNLKWEEKERYTEYKKQIFNILNSGKGFLELKIPNKLGMHLRIIRKEKKIIEILNQNISIEEKSKLISMEICKNE